MSIYLFYSFCSLLHSSGPSDAARVCLRVRARLLTQEGVLLRIPAASTVVWYKDSLPLQSAAQALTPESLCNRQPPFVVYVAFHGAEFFPSSSLNSVPSEVTLRWVWTVVWVIIWNVILIIVETEIKVISSTLLWSMYLFFLAFHNNDMISIINN